MVASLHPWLSLGLAAAVVCAGLILPAALRSGRADPPRPGDDPAPPPEHEPAAGLSFAAEWFDLAPELERALHQALPEARRHAVDLAHAAEPELTLRTDRRTLRAALAALLDQAIRAAPGGKVLLTARREGWVIELALLDDGTSPNPEARRSALRAVTSAIALQGGSLEVTAIPDEGTTVRLRLPAPPPARPETTATPATAPAAPVPLPAG